MTCQPSPWTPKRVQADVVRGSPEAVRVCCIVLNWNGLADTLQCLEALDRQEVRQRNELAVLVVDNGSSDGSDAELERRLAERPGCAIRMELVRSGRNGGFAFGNNVGIEAAAAYRPEFLWLLNNDTVPAPETLRRLVRVAEESERIGLVGSVLYRFDRPEQVQMWGGGQVIAARARVTCFEQPREPADDQFLTFASVLLRAAMVQRIGGLDERFFMYYEDVEFCLRARRAGWVQAVAADTAILHKEGGSGGGDNLRLERVTTTSALLLIETCGEHPRWGQAVYFTRRLAKRALLGHWGNVAAVLAGGREFLARRRLDSGVVAGPAAKPAARGGRQAA